MNEACRRILILRSCRASEFAAAVQFVRRRTPSAEIIAVSHPGHLETLRAAGVDGVVEIPGSRFGVLRAGLPQVRRLRHGGFDEVVIPQMTDHVEAHANLYWFAAAIGARRVVVLPGESEPIRFDTPATFHRWALKATFAGVLRRFDVPIYLAMVAAACAIRLAGRRRAQAPSGSRRRVLLAISSLGVGGAQVQLAELLNRMPADAYEVDLLAFGRDGDFSRQWLRRDDAEVRVLRDWPRLVPSMLEIMKLCRDRHYDIVHTWLFAANVVAAPAAVLARVPTVIASVRNLSVWKREPWYRRWWHRPADVLGSNAADVVTVNARALVADHARWACVPARRIEVVHNGLNPAHFPADRRDAWRRLGQITGAPADAVFVGTVGRLAHEKDQHTFLRIVAELRKSRPDVFGVVIGDGELRARLEGLAHALGIAGHVAFLGSRPDARALMAGFDVFVLTSLSEGFPNVLLEAAFLRVPCVATDVAGNPDVLAYPESLFPAGDAETGAARVLAVLADRDLTDARTAAVRERALELFTSERSVAAWLTLYERLAGGPGGWTGSRTPAEAA